MKALAYISIIVFFFSCKIEPAEIQYNFDQCHFCQMTIVDKSHAAILVTEKGKSEKFDAIECKLRHLNREEKIAYAMMLVSDYLSPGTMIDATSAKFVVSKAIPSPMGAFLSAVPDERTASEIIDQKGGDAYEWQEVIEKFR